MAVTTHDPVARPALTFDDLFEREREAMVMVAFLITRSAAVAEELAHDAFVEVYERWDRVERPGAYLRRCVVNRAVRHNRRHDRVEAIDDRRLNGTSTASSLGYDHTLHALGTLDPKARAMVVLRYYASLSQEEVADAMGIPVGTVKSGLHRALNQLKEVLS